MPAACYVPSTAPRLISCRIRKLTLSPYVYTRSPTHLQTLPSDTSALSSTPPKLCFLAPNCASSTIWCHRKICEIRRSERSRQAVIGIGLCGSIRIMRRQVVHHDLGFLVGQILGA